MWCIECEQEVIVTGKSDRAPPVCPNCQSQLHPGIALRDVPPADLPVDGAAEVAEHTADPSMNSEPEPAVPDDPGEFPAMPTMHWDDWQLDTDADRIQMLLNQFDALSGSQAPPECSRSPSGQPASAQPASAQPDMGTPTPSNGPIDTPPPRAAVSAARPKSSRSPWPAWLILSTGLMLFVCGTVLAGWSLITMRSELWLTGVPVSLVGIACLLIGFVLQLESLWSGHRETMKMLLELDDRMAEIRHATTLLKTSHSGAAQSFYANLADGANPQVLLADLKGQLDLLAQQMARESRRAA